MRWQPILWTSWFAVWLLLAVTVTTLDSVGLASINRAESFPGQTIPPDQLTAFDFWAGLASLFVTIPLECLKIAVVLAAASLLHADPLAPFRINDTVLALANAGFDLIFLLSIPASIAIGCFIGTAVRRQTHARSR